MITVEWLGGPRDGEQVSMPNDTKWIRYAEPETTLFRRPEEVKPGESPAIAVWSVPVVGDRLIWAQRRRYA